MNEHQIIELINATEDQRLNLLQWWGAVTFGLIALSHFASERLNLFLIALVLTLYVSFSLFMFTLFDGNRVEGILLTGDLRALQDEGVTLSGASQTRIAAETDYLQTIGYRIATGGAFFGSIAYLIFAYWQSVRRSRSIEGAD